MTAHTFRATIPCNLFGRLDAGNDPTQPLLTDPSASIPTSRTILHYHHRGHRHLPLITHPSSDLVRASCLPANTSASIKSP